MYALVKEPNVIVPDGVVFGALFNVIVAVIAVPLVTVETV